MQEKEYQNQVIQQFAHLRNKKILIYGTGIIAKRLIKALKDFQLIGAADGLQLGGEVEGLPIIMWDAVKKGEVDVVIIAALERNYREIYQRILDKCMVFEIDICDKNGNNLIKEYKWEYLSREDVRNYRKNERELKKLIEQYEVISFDLFDTLIMRKTLMPTDVFDIVSDRIRRKGIDIPDFKRFRREAELQIPYGDIYQIYDRLSEILDLTSEQKKIVLETELACEQSVLLPRKKMVEVMQYALSLGKKVNIISDMYLCSDILDIFLKNMNIAGYDKIYVSCEYGAAKCDGLFKEYLQDVGDKKCIHIGDNIEADMKAPLRYGMASYGIKSAIDMMKTSNFRLLLPWFNNCNEKSLLGLILADLFNDPFALYETSGIIHIKNFTTLGGVFVAPIVVLCMLELITYLQRHSCYHKVIFGARDGFLFHKMYNRLRDNAVNKEILPDSVYLLTSRKLCLRAAIQTEENVRILERYRGKKSPEEILADMFGIEIEKIPQYDEARYSDINDYYASCLDVIAERTKNTRERYLKFIKEAGVDVCEKNLFFDLISQGTVQYSLNQIFDEPLDGFYVMSYPTNNIPGVQIESVYRQGINAISAAHNFLETIFTSQAASVEDIGEDGKPVYALEVRNTEEISNMTKMHECIEEFFFDYCQNLYIEGMKIGKHIPEMLLGMCNEVEYVDECCKIREARLFDDLTNIYYEVFSE